jgi:ERF superfamily
METPENNEPVTPVTLTPPANLVEALIAASRKFDPVESHRHVKYGTTDFKYANVNDCIVATKKALLENNILLYFITNVVDRIVTVRVRMIHTSGDVWTFDPVSITSKSVEAKEIGATITYARRYALVSALNLAVEEPDVEMIEGAKNKDFHYENTRDKKGEAKETKETKSSVSVVKDEAQKPNMIALIRVLYANASEDDRVRISELLKFSWSDLNHMNMRELHEIKEAFNAQ